MTHTADNYWYAERDYSDGYDPRYQWMPTLQGSGWCHSLPVWFATKADCERFIRTDVLGAELQADDESSSVGGTATSGEEQP